MSVDCVPNPSVMQLIIIMTMLINIHKELVDLLIGFNDDLLLGKQLK